MKILSIGNSFSQDAHKWLSQIAEAYGDHIDAYNLYIGGCSLETHWTHFLSGAADYDLELNGNFIRKTSISDALQAEKWDVITFQQASHFSGDIATYYPYLINLYHAVRKICSSKIYLHQTWAYEIDSAHSAFAQYGNNQDQMYQALTACYQDAADKIHCGMIPAGEVIQYIRQNCAEFDYRSGGRSLNRDGFHLSWLYGRYAAALTWYAFLRNANIAEVKFVPTHESAAADVFLLQIIHNAVMAVLKTKN